MNDEINTKERAADKIADTYQADNVKVSSKKKVPVKLIVIGLLIIGSVLLIKNYMQSKRVLIDAYNKYCNTSSSWCVLSDDGSYLEIDTNPSDSDGSGYLASMYILEANKAIENINKDLGVPEYVQNDMNKTSALDGKQSYSGDKITVTWRYHPDRGLEVTYVLN